VRGFASTIAARLVIGDSMLREPEIGLATGEEDGRRA